MWKFLFKNPGAIVLAKKIKRERERRCKREREKIAEFFHLDYDIRKYK